MLVIRPLAVRNQIGRLLGAPAAVSYTPKQRWVAREIWNFWKSVGYDDDGCAAWVADADGEVSLIPTAVGDHGMARDIAQHWPARRLAIQQNEGIDMINASVTDQCRGIYAEITKPWSPYKHVDELLRAAKGTLGKLSVIVTSFERSKMQGRDVARRNDMAIYWKAQLGKADA